MAGSIISGIRRAVMATVVGATLAAGTASAGVAAAQTQGAADVVDVALDVADLGKLAALEHCATTSFAKDPDQVKVLYGVRQQRSLTATSRTFVLRNGAGKVLLCDLFGRDRPAVLPLPRTSAARPAVLFTPGQRRWACEGTALESFTMTTWLKVQDPVKEARVRYTVGGVPGPWFTSARQGRFIHLQSWLGPVAGGTPLEVELQLLDKAGSPVTVKGIPSGPRELDGCSGDVLIG